MNAPHETARSGSRAEAAFAELKLDLQEALERLRPFMVEDDARSARNFWITWAVAGAAFLAALLTPSWFVRVPAALFLGGLVTRLFILFHDVEHGAIFRRQPFKRFVMRAFGYAVLSPPSVWKAGHSDHHRATGAVDKLVGGEFPVWTIEKYRNARFFSRLFYRISRAPLTVACGYLTGFLFSSCLQPLFANPVRNWRAGVSILAHGLAIFVIAALFGWAAALAAFILPAAVAGAMGVYMIYVQHNAPQIEYAPAAAREPLAAAVKTTTYFDMSPFMHWMTANIGFHNIHHLAPRIPFYRLPEAMAALPEIRPFLVRTSWRLGDIVAAFRANLYDPARRMMAPYAAARA